MKYYASEKNQTTGPFTLEELRGKLARAELSPADKVCLEGSEAWLPLASVLEHAPSPYLSQAPETPPVPRPRRKSGCGCLGTGLLIFFLLLVALAVSSYYVVVHTAWPLRWVASALSGPNFTARGINGSLSSGFSIDSVHGRADNGDEFEAENLKMQYTGFSDFTKRREIIINEISVGKARLIVTAKGSYSSSFESSTTTRAKGSVSSTGTTSVHTTSGPGQVEEGGIKLFRIDRIHFQNIYLKDKSSGFEFAMPEFSYTGFQWTPESVDLGNLRIDSDRLEVTTKPGRTVQIGDKQVVIQKYIEGKAKPLLNRAIKQPIDFSIDAGVAPNHKLFYRLTACQNKLELCFDEKDVGYYKIHELPLASYLSIPGYDLPSMITLDAGFTGKSLDPQNLPKGSFVLGVTEFTLKPEESVFEDKGEKHKYDLKATHKTANGEIDLAVRIQSDEPHVQPNLTSQPPMSPLDLLAQIFYGKAYAELNPDEKKQTDQRIPFYFPAPEKESPGPAASK